MKFARMAALAVVLGAGAVYAQQEPTDSAAIARQDLMKDIGAAMGTLGKMAKGEMAYDAAAAEGAKAALVTAAATVEADFMEAGSTDPASEAKPEIWTSWVDFVKKSDALITAANAADVSSAEAIGASLGALGGACKDCHGMYRVKK